ncbi:MAG: hypothetical protein C0469_15760 [Cyanobacteria bacterium DS2.3.42]|nr:hypothetical protein [Cyanobacteria bacterium DS2.3.42]
MLSALLKPLHTKEKTQVLEAINTLRFKVTPENISLSTSLPVATAAQQLNIIAAETSAHLKVDSTGALLYEFAPGFERAYLFDITKQLFSANGNFFFRALRVALRLALGLAVLLIKVSIALISFLFRAMFGILLIGSIIAIVVGIMAAIAAIFDGADGIDIGGAGDGIGDLATSGFGSINCDFSYVTYDFIRLLDWTYYWGDPGYGCRSYGYSYDYYHAGNIGAAQNSSSERFMSGEKVEKGDFVTNCFSYLFGDGHPNADLKERYWHQIGLVIKRNHGVVVAEQLAPYAGDTSGTEDWMLPILVHFNGSPDVTDKGNILYTFPTFVREDNYTASPLSLQAPTNANGGDPLRDLYRSHLKRQADQSWTGVKAPNAHSQLSRFLEERRWEFSLQSLESAFKIGTITLVNLVGSIWLYNATFTMRILQPFHQISLYMVAYAVFLIALPAFRFLWIMILNLGIDKRNAMRSAYATALSAPSAELRTKISEASVHINHLLLAPKPSIVFTTEEDSLAQQFTSQPTFQHSRNFSR